MTGLDFASLNTAKARGLLYGLVALASLVVFGNVAEICDSHDSCPARLIWIIVFAVAATIVAGFMLFATLFEVTAVLKVEVLLSFVLLVLYSVAVGLISSIRTGLGNVIAVSFSWFCLVVTFILFFATITVEGGLCHGMLNRADKQDEGQRDIEAGQRDNGDNELDEEVPEEAYMYPSGPNLTSDENREAGGTTPESEQPNTAASATDTTK